MRADLLALTTDALTTLTNRGLVKRASKEVEAAAPALVLADDGTLTGTSADGIVTTVPVGGGLDAATCTCGASGVCRHVLVVVLAYQGSAASDPGTALPRDADTGASPPRASSDKSASDGWTPGTFTDEQLEARIGRRLMTAARRAARAGYVARVVRATATDPAPRAELSSCSVRFLVPGDLGFTHTDAVKGARDDVIALAVWAFRVADERHPGAADVQVQVQVGEVADAVEAGLVEAVALGADVLRTGAVHAGAGLAGPVAAVRRTLDAAGLRWPLLAVDDLAEQLAAYADRSTRYRPDLLADLVTELHARHRAVGGGGSGLRSRILGTEEAAQTPLRRLRLDGLGCRVRGSETERVVEIFLAHPDSATVLVVRRLWTVASFGERVAGRRVGGATVAALAAGSVVTESAVRSASRAVRLGTGNIAKTTVGPSAGAWHELPSSLVVRDLMAVAEELDGLPPRFVRPRVEAELVRVVEIAEVRELSYAPGAQRLDAVIADREGWTGVVSSTYRPTAPGGLDSLARALRGEYGRPRFVSGPLRRHAGAVVVDPLAVAVDGRVVVPDLAVDETGVVVSPGVPPAADPIDVAVEGAMSVLAEVAHRGLDHLPAGFGERVSAAAGELSRVGLGRAGRAVSGFAETLRAGPADDAVTAWVDAWLRLAVTSDLR
ncbi:SWIM zinc finger family protein [Virgisporangium ochraceum]|uniref:SWIM-type domain-containing protein n=1 Tax=Virgisporangium ochraceum TaxID=65505 RepID=A0A8J4A0M4_9ACTN|nr:SWIM zinc finger family protein [Virgisporangium ochraceum]GIJ70925.1 hypothetical protein Voc01_058420 [Virgisporangium ochraceum]